MRFVIIFSLASLVWLSAAIAQIGNPAGMAPGTADHSSVAGKIGNTTDQLFVRLAGFGGLAEVDFGELAGKSAQSSEVKAFGQRMAADHSKANLRLAEAAKKADIAVPNELDPAHQAIRVRLANAAKTQFDLDYLGTQVEDHLKTVQLLEWEIDSGQDADIQDFASEHFRLCWTI
jgi:putative membrane protein